MARSGFNASPTMRRATAEVFKSKVARSRLDYQRNGSHLKAILTVTLPNGQTYRFERSADLDVLLALTVNRVGGLEEIGAIKGRDPAAYLAWLRNEYAERKAGKWGPAKHAEGARWELTDPKQRAAGQARAAAMKEKYGVHRVKPRGLLGDIAHAGKKVVTSGVFKTAAKALSTIGPMIPPPIGVAATAAGGAMMGVRALVSAKSHLAAGNTAAAKKLVRYAAKKIPRPMQPAVRAQADRVYALMLRPV